MICLFEQVMECVGVPSLRKKIVRHDAQVIGILGRVFLQIGAFEIDGTAGRITLLVRSGGLNRRYSGKQLDGGPKRKRY